MAKYLGPINQVLCVEGEPGLVLVSHDAAWNTNLESISVYTFSIALITRSLHKYSLNQLTLIWDKKIITLFGLI